MPRLIVQCPYCESLEVNQTSATHLGKKIIVNGQCHKCGQHFEMTWKLDKLLKIIPGQADRELEEMRKRQAKEKEDARKGIKKAKT